MGWFSTCRWIARITGAAFVLMIAGFAVGEGMPKPFAQPAAVQVEFLALALIMIGLIGGWRSELYGGLVSLAGCGLFIGTEFVRHGRANGIFLVFALPGALFFLSGLLRRDAKNRPGQVSGKT